MVPSAAPEIDVEASKSLCETAKFMTFVFDRIVHMLNQCRVGKHTAIKLDEFRDGSLSSLLVSFLIFSCNYAVFCTRCCPEMRWMRVSFSVICASLSSRRLNNWADRGTADYARSGVFINLIRLVSYKYFIWLAFTCTRLGA